MGFIVSLIACDIVVAVIVAGNGIPVAVLCGVPVYHGLRYLKVRGILLHQGL